jgi:hypothetical protein
VARVLVVGDLGILIGGLTGGARIASRASGRLKTEEVEMRALNVSANRRSARRSLGLLSAIAMLASLAGCAAPPRIEVPTELPLRTNDQLFAIQWALQREASVVRAVGRVSPSFDAEARLTLALFGVDAGEHIVSRGITYLQSEFNRQPIPFAVELTPTGREARFELRVLHYHVPGLRTN